MKSPKEKKGQSAGICVSENEGSTGTPSFPRGVVFRAPRKLTAEEAAKERDTLFKALDKANGELLKEEESVREENR